MVDTSLLQNILSTGNDDYLTPPEVLAYWRDRLGVKEFFDPCPFLGLEYGNGFLLPEDKDGLLMPWGENNFVNPPYSHPAMDAFVMKAYQESQYPFYRRSVLVIPPKTDKHIFKNIIVPHAVSISFVRGRISFINAFTGRRVTQNSRGSMFVIFGLRPLGQEGGPLVEVIDVDEFEPFKKA